MQRSDADHARWLCFAFAFLLNACWLYALNERFLLDPDTYWHITVGKEIWQSGRFPQSDIYSHTFVGQPWIAKDWLSQIVLYLAYRCGGWPLVVTLAIFCVSLTGALLYYFLSSRLNNTLALAVAVIALALSMQSYLARPHIFTFPLIIVWTEFLLRASDGQRAPSFWLLPVIALWTNLHSSFVIAFIIAGFCFLNFLERAGLKEIKELRRWIAFLVLCVFASLLNPYGYKAILVTFEIPGNEWLKLPGEWRPFDAGSEPIHELSLLALLFLLLTFGLKLGVAKSLLILATLHLFLSHIRFAYLFYFLVPLIVSFELAVQYHRLSAATWTARLAAEGTGLLTRYTPALSLAALGLYLAIVSAFIALSKAAPREGIAPARALDFARTAGLTGNVLHTNEFGGFLIFNGVKTFLDGRNDQLFRGTFIRNVLRSLQADGADALKKQLQDHTITWTLLRHGDPRIAHLDQDSLWRRAYEDETAVIHVRTRSPNKLGPGG
jgi:hypothetical protein